MRILYHHRTLADGAEGIHIAEMVAAFRGLGHEVRVHGLAGAEGAGGGVAHRIKPMLPPAAFEMAAVASNLPDSIGVRHAIRAARPDFLYKRHARLDVGALMTARRAGIPSVLEVNCLFSAADYERFEPASFPGLVARLERQALAGADVVLAVSTPLARQIERLAGVRAVVLPNGADPARFDPSRADGSRIRMKCGLGAGAVVGWTGVMRPWHGLELLIEAIAQLPDARLLIVGGGPARPMLEAHAARRGVAGRVVITGRVPQEEIPDHLAAMDVAVVASERTGVASPMKMLEYMAMRRAVVAPRLENIQDLVTDGRDGLLFEPDSAADLAHALRRLIDDATLRRALGAEARRTVEAAHTWRANAERVVSLIQPRTAPSSNHAVAIH